MSAAVQVDLEPRPACAGHAVQFYKDDAFLCQAVARFFAEGLGAGENAVGLLVPAHRYAVTRQLAASGVDMAEAEATGRLVLLDARQTLARFMVAGMPDAELFRTVVGGLLEDAGSLRASGVPRAFGEMVDQLWKDGARAAALRLEELWNDLGRTSRFSLLCAYDLRAFREAGDVADFSAVCDAHGHVIPAESYTRLDPAARDREVVALQQRAEALEGEIRRRRHLEEALRRALDEARTLSRLKDEFLSVVSHELRTPLNAILGWSTVLRSRPHADVVKAATTIERNARAQLRVIEDVLDVSRIISGKLRLEMGPLDLARVLRDAIEVAAPAAAAKGVELVAYVDAEPCPFVGDGVRLHQLLWNLVSNAIKFTPEGGRVEVRLASVGTSVEVVVRDTGCGIHPDFLPYVFDRFRQADASTTRPVGGLGLGLAIARHLAEAHGGSVCAASDGTGCGATFTVTLPVRNADPG